MPHLNRFQLTLNEDYSDYHTSGFSGSGVFVNLNGAVYLLGIFTRFRAEEKGRVIYCQYIEKINELLKRSHLPLINFSYTAGYGLTLLFFINQVEASIANLGPRFSEKLNFKLPIARHFNDIVRDDIFFKRLIKVFDDWLTEKGYNILKDNKHIGKIETELNAIRQSTITWLDSIGPANIAIIQIQWLLEKIESLNNEIKQKLDDLYILRSQEKRDEKSLDTYSYYSSPYSSEIERLRNINKANDDFADNLQSVLNIKLSNYPFLIIKGDAGSGKSHLLGDIASSHLVYNLVILHLCQACRKPEKWHIITQRYQNRCIITE